MKREILVFVFSIVLLNSSFGQHKVKFKSGTKLIKNSLKSEYKNPKSILFIFDVFRCEANFYINLAKKLKRRFRKSKIDVLFNFNINTTKNIETEKLPKKKYPKNDVGLVCYVSISDFKSWDNSPIETGKQNYNLNLIFENSKTNEKIGTIKININSYYTIITQNKNSSRLIYRLITE